MQAAKVTEAFPWNSRVHECDQCNYVIMESEWEPVGHTYWNVWSVKDANKKVSEIAISESDFIGRYKADRISRLKQMIKLNGHDPKKVYYEQEEPF